MTAFEMNVIDTIERIKFLKLQMNAALEDSPVSINESKSTHILLDTYGDFETVRKVYGISKDKIVYQRDEESVIMHYDIDSVWSAWHVSRPDKSNYTDVIDELRKRERGIYGYQE